MYVTLRFSSVSVCVRASILQIGIYLTITFSVFKKFRKTDAQLGLLKTKVMVIRMLTNQVRCMVAISTCAGLETTYPHFH